MYFAGIVVWVILAAPVVLEVGVTDTQLSRFQLAMHFNQHALKKLDKVQLLVSRDQGRSWKCESELRSSEFDSQSEFATRHFKFASSGDGEYWFGLRVLYSDSDSCPPSTNERTVPILKVYVNTARRPVLRRSKPLEMKIAQ